MMSRSLSSASGRPTRPVRAVIRAVVQAVVQLLLLGSLALAVTSCNRPLGEADCKKLVDKMVDLLAETEEKADKVKPVVQADKALVVTLRETCVGKMTRAQYDCILAAKTFEAAAACDAK